MRVYFIIIIIIWTNRQICRKRFICIIVTVIQSLIILKKEKTGLLLRYTFET